jgi:AGZA family xanthine/uracil permease-like MFS transporter
MTSARTWVGILGFVIMAVMLAYKERSAFICGIGLITVISWFRNTAITYFPDTQEGDARFEYFKQVVNIESVNELLAQYTGNLSHVGVALITFLYVDFLDTSGTLLGLAHAMGVVDEEGNFPKSRAAFSADALATMFGSIFGLSPVTSYIESGSGVEAGSKTGLTACICGFYFFLSIFFAPIIASIPPWATGGALIIVGALMCRSLGSVKWWDITHAITAFLTVIVMPLTYSIAYGLIAGIGAYMFMHGTFWLLSFVGIEKPVFTNPDDFYIEPEDAFDVSDNVKAPMDETANDDDMPNDEEAGTSSAEVSDDLNVSPDDADLKASDEVET